MKVSLLGDIHGSWSSLDNGILQAVDAGSVALIQVGDFGLFSWRKETHKQLRTFLQSPIPVYFIEGNHDDCTYWTQHTKKFQPFDIPNLWYMPRGTVETIGGIRFGFLGGGASIDKDYRLRQNMHWDPRENINMEESARLNGKQIDVLVTHTPPNCIIDEHFDPKNKLFFGVGIDWKDPNAYIVEDVWHSLGCPLNISGHMHKSVRGANYQILNIDEVLTLDSEDFRHE